jgi:hypothetical protein
MIFNEAQQAVANKIEQYRDISHRRNWKWQLKHPLSGEHICPVAGINHSCIFENSARAGTEIHPYSGN